MRIRITNKKRLSEIQNEFRKIFPYLKIEFIFKSASNKIPPVGNLIEDNNRSIEEYRVIKNKSTKYITAKTTVAELENIFWDFCGLSAHVFRKSGNSWLETTATDSWTLDKQNSQGEALSNYLANKMNLGN